MREIKEIIVHCSATKIGQPYTIDKIDIAHRNQGWNGIGYHYVIYADGSVHKGRNEEAVGAHCSGRNTNSLGLCYIGGLDENGKAADTRTEAQRQSMRRLIRQLIMDYPTIKQVIGHRDTSPDLNGNGKVDKEEWVKACPCFDAIPEYKSLVNNWNSEVLE